MSATEIAAIAAGAGAALGACLAYRPGRALDELGRSGAIWFERPEERPLGERPAEDGPDAPLPRRPLRARY
jgi:hypothetical protein